MSSLSINKNSKKFLTRLYGCGSLEIDFLNPPIGVSLDYLEKEGLILKLMDLEQVCITEKGLQFVEYRGWN